MQPEFKDARILVVEDEALLSMLVEDVLADLGCDVAGPAASLASAIALAKTEPLLGALLDVNIGGESVYPVADILKQRGIPFVFVTGYNAVELAPPHDRAPLLEKPFDEAALTGAIRTVLLPKAA
jgi:CheY-like chemotaxis protein